MNRFLHGMARAVFETFDLPSPVLEIGSFQVHGQEAIADLRSFFPSKSYLGLDMRAGNGVDVIGSVERLPFADGSLGSVVALSTFEHVQRFWTGFDEIRRVLRPDGALLVACPFHFHIHDHPSDYWRFTPDALRMLLADYPNRLIGSHGPRTRPANVWALAFREEGRAIAPEQVSRYETLMRQHAREPMPLMRRMRYQMGRWLCGNRPFAPWLQRDEWEVDYHGTQGVAC